MVGSSTLQLNIIRGCIPRINCYEVRAYVVEMAGKLMNHPETLQLLRLLSAQQNRENLQAVLDLAERHDDAFWDSQLSRAEVKQAAPHFPFLNTCIAVASFFPESGQDAFSRPEPPSIPKHLDMDDGGMTLIDITQVDGITYGFSRDALSIKSAMEVAEKYSLKTELAVDIERWLPITSEDFESLQNEISTCTNAPEPDLTQRGSKKRKRDPGSQSRARPKTNVSSRLDRFNQQFSMPFQSPDQVPHSEPSGCVAQIMYLSYRPEFDGSPPIGEGIPWSSLPHGNFHNSLGRGFAHGSVVPCNVPLGGLSQGQLVRLTRLFLTYLAHSKATPTASDVAMAAAKSFSLVSDGLDDSQSRVGPFPLAIYANAIDLRLDSESTPPKLRQMMVGEWTLIIVHEQSYFRHQPKAEKFRYAFISTDEPPPLAAGWHPPKQLKTVDGTTFLHATLEASSDSNSGLETVTKEWNDIVQRFKLVLCEPEESAEIIEKAMVDYSRRSYSASRLWKTVSNPGFDKATEDILREQISDEFEPEIKQLSPASYQQCFKSIFGLQWLESRNKHSKAWRYAWDTALIYPLVICLIALSLITDPQVLRNHPEFSGKSLINTSPDEIFLGALKGELSGLAPCLMRLTPWEKSVIAEAVMLKSEGFDYLQRGIPTVRVCCLLQISQYLGQQPEAYAESLSDDAYAHCAILYSHGVRVVRKESHKSWPKPIAARPRQPILKIGMFAVAKENDRGTSIR